MSTSPMKRWWGDGLACAGLLAVCFALTRPTVELSRGDDFSYAKTALEFARTGHFVYNAWATAAVGWLAVWGGAFIAVFGFSQTLLRISMLLLGMITVALFHQVLIGFGVDRRNAVLGALTLGLSPLFLNLTASFMTDLPGLVFLVLCAWMCQKAAQSGSDRRAILWLIFAAALNLLGGTVRQTTWLGALVMVPSTAWFLWGRQRRSMALKVMVPAFLASFVSVLLILHWCDQQPYFVKEKLLPGGWQGRVTPINLLVQPAKAFATVMMLALPVGVAWLAAWTARLRRLSTAAKTRSIVFLSTVLALCLGFAAVLAHRGTLASWLPPWEGFDLISLGMNTLPTWILLTLAVVPVLVVAAWLQEMLRARGAKATGEPIGEPARLAIWLLGPFTAAYACLLVPRGLYGVLDRYSLSLLMSAILFCILLYERQARGGGWRPRLPAVCVAVLVLFSAYGVGSVHDSFAEARAWTVTLQALETAGVPRTAVTLDLGPDAWYQVNAAGHVNFDVKNPAGTYHPVPAWTERPECEPMHSYLVPLIQPKYILLNGPSPCFPPSQFAPLAYRIWLPPFQRSVEADLIR